MWVGHKRDTGRPAPLEHDGKCHYVRMATPPTAIGALTIDCDDAEAMGRFYVNGLGGERDPFPHAVCVRVDGLLLAFREVPDYRPPSWPGSSIQMHLEV